MTNQKVQTLVASIAGEHMDIYSEYTLEFIEADLDMLVANWSKMTDDGLLAAVASNKDMYMRILGYGGII